MYHSNFNTKMIISGIFNPLNHIPLKDLVAQLRILYTLRASGAAE